MQEELIKKLFCSVDARSWHELTDIFHVNVVYERPGYIPFEGIEQLLHFYKEERVVLSGTHYLEGIISHNNYGACWGKFIGVKKDGSKIDERFADTYLFAEGKIKMRRSYFFRPAI